MSFPQVKRVGNHSSKSRKDSGQAEMTKRNIDRDRIAIVLNHMKFKEPSLSLVRKTFALALLALTIILLCPLLSYADPVAEIIGTPNGLTNQTNPTISIGGNDVVSYRYKLDSNDYSGEIPVNTPISFSADVTIFGQQFSVGPVDLQNFLDDRTGFIDSVDFRNVTINTPVVFLLNEMRMTLQNDNILYIEGSNIDQLDVHMNNSPSVPPVFVNQSLSAGNGYITYDLTTDTPQTDYIRIINHSSNTASFRMNLNNMLFSSDNDVLNEIQAMPAEYINEPIERKVWRFIRDNRYHWYPLTADEWISSRPSLYFNSVGFGFCDSTAMLYCQLMTSLGYQARVWWLTGHVVPEVLINGNWEMYDPDGKVYYYDYTGEVAGVEELAAHPDLITNPINPVVNVRSSLYSQAIADLYSSTSNNTVVNYDFIANNYLLNLQLPAGGILEFPAVFASPIHTSDFNEAPYYTDARLTIPSGWTGTLDTTLVIHSIGYDGPHTLYVIGKDSAGNWQTAPTVAIWTTDSWAPITTPYQPDTTSPVTLTANEPATIYYTLDGSNPTTSSSIYSGPIDLSSSPVLKFFAIDLAGNREQVKCYSPTTGEVYLEPATAIAVTMDKSSPQIQGTIITFTAAATGGSGSYEYAYYLRNPVTNTWSLVQAYSSNPAWIWNTAGIDTGTYAIQVLTRSAGSTASYEVYSTKSYTITLNSPPPPPATAIAVTMDKSSPQIQGTIITFTAAATGGSGSYEYAYYLRNPVTNTWSLVQAYSSNPAWIWNTAGIDTGTYAIQVLTRSAGSTASYEVYSTKSYTITLNSPSPPPATAIAVTMDKSSPQIQGTIITFTAAATGGSGSYEYAYYLRNPVTNTWSLVQAYSSNPAWIWNTAGIDTGTYAIQVLTRSAGSTASYEVYSTESYTITLNSPPPPATAIAVTMDKSSPQIQGTIITFTAAATGGSGSYEYAYYLRNPVTNTWSLVQAYSSNPAWIWNTAGIDTGTYAIQVLTRSAGSTASYEVYSTKSYTITLNSPPPPATAIAVTMDKSSPQNRAQLSHLRQQPLAVRAAMSMRTICDS